MQQIKIRKHTMNVLLCTSLPFVPAALAHRLIPEGINVISVASPHEIEKAMPAIGKICFIDDLHLDKMDLIRLASLTKKAESSCRFVLLSKSSDVSVLRMFVRMGFDAVLPSSWTPEVIAARAYDFIRKYCNETDQRRFIRVKTDPSEPAKIKIEKSGNLEGRITDISMGGVAASFHEMGALPIEENRVIQKAQIVLDGKSIFADMKLVKKKDRAAAFTFQQISDHEKDSLAEYIYYKTFLSFNSQKNV